MVAVSASTGWFAPDADADRPCRVVLLSDDPTGVRAVLEGFEVLAIPFVGAEHDLARTHADVILVDAAGSRRFAEVASIAALATPGVVVIGPPGEPEQAMRYLDLGACDYVSLESGRSELAARLRAVARSAAAPDDELVVGPAITISSRRREVRRDGIPVRLTPHEFALLETLASQRGALVTHRQLAASVWASRPVSAQPYVRLYIRQLREKIEADPAVPSVILTVRGEGYRLACDTSLSLIETASA